VPPTPQYAWPLLRQRWAAGVGQAREPHAGRRLQGARRPDLLRGAGARAAARARRDRATRGNHGQSVGWGARRIGLAATIVVPHGNSVEKNAAMRALGVDAVEHGDDFQAAREHAIALAPSAACTWCRRSTATWCWA
jgi:threonine dehydratase